MEEVGRRSPGRRPCCSVDVQIAQLVLRGTVFFNSPPSPLAWLPSTPHRDLPPPTRGQTAQDKVQSILVHYHSLKNMLFCPFRILRIHKCCLVVL